MYNKPILLLDGKKLSKMGIDSAKSWFVVDRSGKLIFFTDCINVKKGHSVVFFILYSKRYIDDVTGI